MVLTSDNCLTGSDRVAEASLEIDADIFVNVQGDEPLIDPKTIKKVIQGKQNHPNHVVNCMSRLHKEEDSNNNKIPKVICDLEDNLIYVSRNPIPGSKNNSTYNYLKQLGIYAFSKNQLNEFYSTSKTPLESMEDVEIIRCIEKGIKVKMIEIDEVSYAVDYPEDIEVIEKSIDNG